MAATKLDGPGTQKLKTLEEALHSLQTLHGLVERMAMDLKQQRPTTILALQVKRLSVPLQGQLKGQFAIIADQVSAMILTAGRGGSESIRVRSLREYVAQIRAALEIAVGKVKEQHAVEIDSPGQ